MSLISSVLVVVVSYYTISLSFVDLKKKIQRNHLHGDGRGESNDESINYISKSSLSLVKI